MHIYVAAPFVDRHQMPAIAAQVEEAGHSITARWWEYEDRPGGKYPSNEDDPYYERLALLDFNGVVYADAIIVLNTGKSEGKAVETGIALTMHIPVVVVGTRSNIFHYMPGVVMVESIDEALVYLEGRRDGLRLVA